ncbi:guanine nucleotide-binding protein G(T) subunit gamma-T1 isoform X2 [Aquila chrysaetos chrysaetos]|uniref:guanine nucleotide-binding protein G(T) subunit gamma-T1 isoform X2 n=1 Tax=Aquila chrysaetos chrysaetos TaxID=223781 RepID=UPI001176BCF7|nr:guanine nucleotide-binding protein G(T) subunit gamma-T1 isoform X2 [Aquila chrysaetos chrysaetos]XP_029864311.1 guanine nucleotide-binding protein G(T) subunit gamma-T1 isoform X2 [Aquila chrysaetos chrysaetos]
MPAINIEDLSEKDKLKMEVEQLRKEVKLERQPPGLCSHSRRMVAITEPQGVQVLRRDQELHRGAVGRGPAGEGGSRGQEPL